MRVSNHASSGSIADSTLPPEVEDRSAWYAPDWAARTDWVEQLTDVEIGEVERAGRDFERTGREIGAFTAKDVPLPTLAPRLQRILDEVLNGRGFAPD
jgi:hypothetical protein